MNRTFSRESLRSRSFALFDLLIVVIGAAVLCLFPDLGPWTITASLIPWGIRLAMAESPFRRTRFDFFIAVFLLTAISGYWVAYNQTAALHKLYLIVTSVLFYYALSAQPGENIVWVSVLFFCIGVGTALYFLLTHDFIGDPRKVEMANRIGRWVMQVRPVTGWSQIHPNYAAGLAAMVMPFGYYLVLKNQKNAALLSLLIFSLFLIATVILLATSRGVWMAIVGAAGMLGLWKLYPASRVKHHIWGEAVFPSIVIIFLLSVVMLLYAGPAWFGGNVVGQDKYGSGTRVELFWRSVYLVSDFPITGGGLGAFPGLYSQYILGIPNYYLPNAHNTFLDIFIEQGVFGGFAFVVVFLGSIWMVARILKKGQQNNFGIFDSLLLVSIIIACLHGLVDDYLYNGAGTILGLFLAGITVSRVDTEPLFKIQWCFDRTDIIVVSALSIVFIGLIVLYQQTIRSIWYSNIGAVQMARVELDGFPTNEWAGPKIVVKLRNAEASLLASIEADPSNRTANHRLGLISMLRRDFKSASGYLSHAHSLAPHHRGIVKALGYSSAWQGDLSTAQTLLMEIPESSDELDVYRWWWEEQGYESYARNSSVLLSTFPLLQP